MGPCCSDPQDKNKSKIRDFRYPNASLIKQESGFTVEDNLKDTSRQPAVQRRLSKMIRQNRTLHHDIDINQQMRTIVLNGTQQQLSQILEVVARYRYCFLLYLVPIHQIMLQQAPEGKIQLLVPDYQINLVSLASRTLQKYKKYLLMLRIVRAMRFLTDKQIRLSYLNEKNIYVQEDSTGFIPKLGLPDFSEIGKVFRASKSLSDEELAKLNQKLCVIFLTIVNQKEIQNNEVSTEIKNVADYKLQQILLDLRNDKNPLSLISLSKRILDLDFEDPMREIPEDKKMMIEYQGGQKYEGQAIEGNIKQGYGKQTDNIGNYYIGEWQNNQREGFGTYVMPSKENYIYIGRWKNNIIDGNGFQLSANRTCWYQGSFVKGKKQGQGLLQGLKGEIYQGEWKNDLKEGRGTYFDANNEWAYKGNWTNDLKNGQAQQLYSNGAYFKGNLVHGVKQGYGQYNIPHKFSYKGHFVDNKFQGQGEYIDYKDKSTYKGGYHQNMYHGRGTYSKPDYSYDGQWSKGSKQGQGSQVIGSSAKYRGQFMADLRHGKGVLEQNGEMFEGTFHQGSYSGEGVYKYHNGDKYEGKFKNKKKEGHGVYTYHDGSVYSGDWKNDKRHGKGKYSFQNGGFYEGDWVDGKREGKGKQRISENSHYQGDWKNDKKQGWGKLIQPNGNNYQGQFKQNMKHGKGKLIYSNGDIYEGQFKDNLHDGQGTYYFKNKDKYQGQWAKGHREGRGTLTKANGEYYEGQWKDNHKNGKGKEVYKNKLEYFEGEFKDDIKEGDGVLYNKKYGRLECTWIKNKRQGIGHFYFTDGTVQAREYRNNVEINLISSQLHISQSGN